MGLTTAIAAIGAGAAVKGVADAKSNASKAMKSQEAQNEANRAFIEKQIGQAREDAFSLYPLAEQSLLAGNQAALNVFGQAAPQQMQALLAGGDAARQAILGTGSGQLGFTPNLSFMQQALPALQAAPISQPVTIAEGSATTLPINTTDPLSTKAQQALDQLNLQNQPSTPYIRDDVGINNVYADFLRSLINGNQATSYGTQQAETQPTKSAASYFLGGV